MAVVSSLGPETKQLLALQDSILSKLVPDLGLDDLPLDHLGDEDLWQRVESAIVDLVETMESGGEIPNSVDQDQLIKETLNEALGLGALEDLLADDTVQEIVVDHVERVLISRGEGLSSAGTGFSSDAVLRRVVQRLAAPTGTVVDELNPFIDVRLRDGSRLAAALPPVAGRGTCLTLRKPIGDVNKLDGLVGRNTLNEPMAEFLRTCVNARRNILVCGAPSSGKGLVLGALGSECPEAERVVLIEEVSKLQLDREHWIALESRPGDGNGIASINVDTLLRGAMRMRPDRLVVADIHGTEAFELLQAMLGPCDGTLLSITGEGASASLGRLATLASLIEGTNSSAIREMVACAIDVVVHVVRYADGTVRVSTIDEVIGSTEAGYQSQTLFRYRGEAQDFGAEGVVPGFYADLQERGLDADASIFNG